VKNFLEPAPQIHQCTYRVRLRESRCPRILAEGRLNYAGNVGTGPGIYAVTLGGVRVEAKGIMVSITDRNGVGQKITKTAASPTA
jgi:hypothetical protein